MVDFIHRNGAIPPATEGAVAAAERSLGVRFPEDYRRFLLEHNGGTPIPDTFFVKDMNQYALVDCFFGVARSWDDPNDFFNEVRDELSEKQVPIGIDPCGNILLMDLSDEDASRVYYYDCEATERENTYLVASSFSDFLSKLQGPPEEEG